MAAVVALLAVVGVVVALVLLTLGKGLAGQQANVDSMNPPVNAGVAAAVAATGSIEATTQGTKVVIPVTNKDVFTSRDPFVPVLKALPAVVAASTDTTPSAERSQRARARGYRDEQRRAPGARQWNGVLTNDLKVGETIEGSPWQLLSLTKTTATMLYGDVQVTLSIGEGVEPRASPSGPCAHVRVRHGRYPGIHPSSWRPRMRYSTAGESHGRALVALLTGVPAGLAIDLSAIDEDLARRQRGYGRGGRQSIERDRAVVLAGIRGGRTLGSPIALTIANRDWENWTDVMSPLAGSREARGDRRPPRSRRPAGCLKTGATTLATSSSARARVRPAARVAAGGSPRRC